MKSFLCFFLLMWWTSSLFMLSKQQQQPNDDVVALMAFKQSSVQSDPYGIMANWNPNSSNPCSWKGIFCSPSDRVAEIDLSQANLIGRLHVDHLMALQSLLKVHLHGNFFSGDLSEGSSFPPCNFETFNLASNNLSEPISDTFLVSCNRLASLNLSGNAIPGGNFSLGASLRELDLSRNRIADNGILNCQKLNLLNISHNKLTGKLAYISSCKNLSSLDLSYNLLSGEIPANFVADSPISLKYLDLSHNNFSGNFSVLEFGDCGNLRVLDLSHNRLFSGIGFPGSLKNCQELEKLDLSHNLLENKIPWELGDLRNLQQLSLAHNQFSGEIPKELGRTCGALRELDLSGNRLSGGFPSTFLLCSSSLQSLNLGKNELSGDFLDTIVSTFQSLRYLNVPFNNITGSIPLSLTNLSQLQVLDLSSNGFTGNIPPGFCLASSSALEKILLASNFLSGTVPLELGNCKNMRTIDFSFNNLMGLIPPNIWELPNLSDLVMWANNLTGEIPDGICPNGGNLETLILNNNFITGNIPLSITKCSNLIWVSLSSNRLTGEIPGEMGDLHNLAVLQLGNNSLTGEIPVELGRCRSLIWLDLNSNRLTGSIPPQLANQSGFIIPGHMSGKQFAFVRNEGGTACRGAGGLVEFEGIRTERLAGFPMLHSCPSTRIYTGLAVYSFTQNGSIIYLDLSYNTLSGIIPHNFGLMSYLQVLNLGHNNLIGTIPESMGDLKQIGVLDLSHNNLAGFVPGSLGTLSFLSDLDVSNNNLTGPIPLTGQLTTFPSSRYENNSGLCGVPLPPCGIGGRPTISKLKGKKQSMTSGVIVVIVVSLFCILGLALTLYWMKNYQREDHHQDQRNKYMESLPTSGGTSSWKLSGVLEPLSINIATFEKPLRKLTFAHLLQATNGFSADSLIGSGGFGEVYRARLPDGCIVAIKKLIHVGQGEREFTAEMETIGKVKHRNLVPLLGYCKIEEERLLVYKYMKWGSLEAVLHDGTRSNLVLDWGARKKIAIGSARGLAFLHHSCIPHIIHRDMKSSNVLLDENLEARVSDFGMARLMNVLDTHLSVSTLVGTPGYVPPEYYQSFRCTTKGDVYSYGVILLELLSGKRPIDPLVFGEENNLVGWAKQMQKEKTSNEILDPCLMGVGQEIYQTEQYQYLKIAFECLDERPFRRPTMIQVIAMFKELQIDSENDILDDLSPKKIVIEET